MMMTRHTQYSTVVNVVLYVHFNANLANRQNKIIF